MYAGVSQPVMLLVGAALLSMAGAGLLGVRAWTGRRRALVEERIRNLVEMMPAGQAESRRRLVSRLFGALVTETARRQLSPLLYAAGIYHSDGLCLFQTGRLSLAASAAVATAGYVLWTGEPPQMLATALATGALAYLLPRWMLNMRAVARQARIRKEMSFLADLMALVLESGLSLDQCLRYVAGASERTSPCVRQTFKLLTDDINNGLPYETAIERWGERLGIPEGREIGGVFRQSLLYGSELGPMLRGFSEEWADRRINAAREHAGRSAARMTAVLVGFMLPPLIIMMAGPAMVSVAGSLRTMGMP